MPELTLLEMAGLDEAGCRRRLDFLDFGPEDEANLAEIRQFARDYVDDIVDSFYRHLLAFEETRRLLRDDQQIARLKRLQREYFLQLTEGRLDAAYFESRLRVGETHQRMDLSLPWYIGSYNLYLRLIMDCLRDRYRHDPDRLMALTATLTKVIFLDLGLAIDAYIMGGFVDRALAQEYRRMADVAERTVREKEDLEHIKANLTNMIVHDLKGPLAGILTVTQLALRKRAAMDPAHARHFEQIQRSAGDLSRMIENLLEIDQMQEGRLELRVEPVDVGSLLKEAAEEFRAAAELSGKVFAVSADPELPAIATDRWLLRRVLNNLVINAIRHSGTAVRIDLEAESRPGVVHIRVRDTGRGIASEDQEMLFRKERRRRSAHGHREDTGLGLVFCKMAVELMRGTIGVVSAPGQGATFIVTLPLTVDPT